MKKYFALLLALLMMVSVMTACGGSSGSGAAATEAPASQPENGSPEAPPADESPEGPAEASWPSGTVTLYVPAGAGGGTDIAARAVASAISESTGTSVIVSNLTAGNGTVAYETVREANADGTELLFFHANFFLNYYNGIYDHAPLEDFTPIAVCFALVPQVIVVSADSEYESLDDLVAAAGASSLTAGCQNGGFDDLILRLLSADAGVDFKMVEAGSETERITALLGRNIDVAVISANAAVQYAETGDMRILASSADARDPNYEDIPTCVELGYENTVFDTTLFVFGPKDMDPALVKAMNAEFNATADNDFVQEYLNNTGSRLAMYDIDQCDAYLEELDTAIKSAVAE